MRHLRRYNESNDSSFIEFIDECFTEFIDDDAEVDFSNDSDENTFYNIKITLPGIKYENGRIVKASLNTLEDRLKHSNELVNFYEKIEDCVNRVKSRYEHVRYSFKIDTDYNTSSSAYSMNDDEIETCVDIEFLPPKNIIVRPDIAGKLGTIKFSELDNTWDVRSKRD